MRSEEKITANEILDAICEDIKTRLRRNDVFGNDSLCYSGAAYKLDIAVTLRSRAETSFEHNFVSNVGEIVDTNIVAVATGHAEKTLKKTRKVQLLDKVAEDVTDGGPTQN